jgi:hypothetical protein
MFLVCTSTIAIGESRMNHSVVQEVKVMVEDSVRKITPLGSSDKIIFNKHAGIYYLRTDSKHYEVIKSALTNSQKTGDSIQLRANATSMEIEEIILGKR